MKCKNRSVISQASDYLKGLLHCSKKKATCTGMEDHLSERNSQSYNHFISGSTWDWQKVMDRIAVKCHKFFITFLGAPVKDICLVIDEVGYKKSGNHSACVSRQWLGCLGKQDMGQVAVAALLSYKSYFSLISMRLFMPECWEKDIKRRRKAHIPDDVTHKTKPAMSLDMIRHIAGLNIKFGWIVFDALYGSCLSLLYELDELKHWFMAEARNNLQIYLQLPNIGVPQSRQGKGRKPKKLKADIASRSTKDYLETLKDTDWTELTIRDGTKRKITGLYHRAKIWIWDENKQNQQPFSCYLFIKKSLDGKDVKFCITNAPENTPIEELAYAQGQRFYIEQEFKEGKNQVGMGDYQVRGWDGFHHHMTCCMLALNYLMEQKHFFKKGMPFITAEDIRAILVICFPARPLSKEQKLRKIKKKHDRYKKQIKRNLAKSK